MELRCDNCGRTYAHENELACVFPDIPDLCTRIEPSGIVPHGECPNCGCLVYDEPESEPETHRCLACGDLVDVNGFRDHLESHLLLAAHIWSRRNILTQVTPFDPPGGSSPSAETSRTRPR
jgi:hypothetical protein